MANNCYILRRKIHIENSRTKINISDDHYTGHCYDRNWFVAYSAIAEKNVFHTLAVGLLMVLLMILTEYLEMKFDLLETISTGKAKIVIENGQLNLKNLKKLRMTVDRLETRLRQSGISSIEDIKHATIEVSGHIGYELNEDKKPVTKEEFQLLMNEIAELKKLLGDDEGLAATYNDKPESSIFTEVKLKEFEGDNEPT